jgi:type IV secretion system protein VirB1
VLPGLEQLLAECAPQVAPDTMSAIVRVESSGNPLAINVNGAQRLVRQPRNRQEAQGWVTWLIAHGYSVDMGLTQVNSRNLQRLGVSAEQMFEPCDNLKTGARILIENYVGASKRYGSGEGALRAAISAYNTGNYQSGFSNGYVAKIDAVVGSMTGMPPPLVARGAGNARPDAGLISPGARADAPQVFVYGRGSEYQGLPRAAGLPLVTWVRK